MSESDYVAVIGGIIFIMIVVGVVVSYSRLPHHKEKISMSSLLYRLENAETTIREAKKLCQKLLNMMPKIKAEDPELAIRAVGSIKAILEQES